MKVDIVKNFPRNIFCLKCSDGFKRMRPSLVILQRLSICTLCGLTFTLNENLGKFTSNRSPESQENMENHHRCFHCFQTSDSRDQSIFLKGNAFQAKISQWNFSHHYNWCTQCKLYGQIKYFYVQSV